MVFMFCWRLLELSWLLLALYKVFFLFNIIFLMTATRRQRKKAVVQQPLWHAHTISGGFEKSRPPLFSVKRKIGGQRREPPWWYVLLLQSIITSQKKPIPCMGQPRPWVCTIPCKKTSYYFQIRPVGLRPAGRILSFTAIWHSGRNLFQVFL